MRRGAQPEWRAQRGGFVVTRVKRETLEKYETEPGPLSRFTLHDASLRAICMLRRTMSRSRRWTGRDGLRHRDAEGSGEMGEVPLQQPAATGRLRGGDRLEPQAGELIVHPLAGELGEHPAHRHRPLALVAAGQ